MSQQFLYGANIVIGLQQMRGKGVSQGVTSNSFIEVTGRRCPLYGFLQGTFVQVVPTDSAATGVYGQSARGKQKLPLQFIPCIRVFAREGAGQANLTMSGFEIMNMYFANSLDLLVEVICQACRERNVTVFVPLCLVDEYASVIKIDILDT